MNRTKLLLLCAALMAASPTDAADLPARTIPFSHHVIDAHPPTNPWYKLVGDLDGDGTLEVLVGGSKGPLVAYAQPGWTRTTIAAGGWNGVRGATGDADRDGDTDLVMGGILWLRNPRRGGGEWSAQPIDQRRAHDVQLADLDRDGRLDVVARDQSAFGRSGNAIYLYRQGPDLTWTPRTLSCPHGEGLAVADLDADGDPDIVIAGQWYENPGAVLEGVWAEHPYTAAWTEPDAKVELADLNRDGRLDVVLTPAELAGERFRVAWYEAPPNPRAADWREHVVRADVECVLHSLGVGDLDLDGDLDLVAAEMHQGADPDEVVVYENLGRGDNWRPQVLSDHGSHDVLVTDLDGDGDLDILGANHGGPRQAVELWRNETKRH